MSGTSQDWEIDMTIPPGIGPPANQVFPLSVLRRKNLADGRSYPRRYGHVYLPVVGGPGHLLRRRWRGLQEHRRWRELAIRRQGASRRNIGGGCLPERSAD